MRRLEYRWPLVVAALLLTGCGSAVNQTRLGQPEGPVAEPVVPAAGDPSGNPVDLGGGALLRTYQASDEQCRAYLAAFGPEWDRGETLRAGSSATTTLTQGSIRVDIQCGPGVMNVTTSRP